MTLDILFVKLIMMYLCFGFFLFLYKVYQILLKKKIEGKNI